MDSYPPKNIWREQIGHCGMKKKRDTEFQGGGLVDLGENKGGEWIWEKMRGWRNDTGVKGTGYPCRGLRFDS